MGRPIILYNDPDVERKHSFIKYFASRVLNNNKNFLCAVTGPTGAGKSWLCGAISEIYSKEYGIYYNPKVHTIFSVKELLDLINRKDLDDVLPPGSIVMFDEPQVSVNSRDWRSEANQVLNTLTSTFRNMRLIILFATPFLEFIDKQSRILFHAEIEVKGYDKTTGLSLCKPRLLEWNPRKGDFYKKRLVVKYPDREKTALEWYFVQHWTVPKPSKQWQIVYEAAKLAFTKKLNRELKQQFEYSQSVQNKGRDLVRLIELWDDGGYNLRKFSTELPHLSPYALERLVAMVRKQKKEEEKARKEEAKAKLEQSKLENKQKMGEKKSIVENQAKSPRKSTNEPNLAK